MAIVLGGIWFWMLLCVAFVAVTAAVESRRSSGVYATVGFIAGLAIFMSAGSWGNFRSSIEYAQSNPLALIGWIVLYAIVGLLWAAMRWQFYLRNKRKRIMEELEASTTGAVYGSKTPTAADHRDDIIMWMSFWPFSVWWRILKDPVRWAFVSLFEWFQSGFDRIAKSMFADVEKLAEKKQQEYDEERKRKQQEWEEQRKKN